MVRKFLYFVVIVMMLIVGALFALRVWGDGLQEIAFVPTGEFVAQDPLSENAYRDTAMWLSHPRFTERSDPARWQPEGVPAPGENTPEFAVFFVHPTSYLERTHWNAPLDDAESRSRARTFLRGMASPFGGA